MTLQHLRSGWLESRGHQLPTAFWRLAQGESLVERFGGDDKSKLVGVLRFLRPLSRSP